jgi:hypothetical protein
MGQVTSSSTQVGNQNLSSTFIGSCSVTCDNTMNNVGINNIGSNIAGDVGIYQTCSANGQCVISNSMSSAADLMFKAANAAQSDFFAQPFQRNATMSYQEINQNIQQYASTSCNVSSSNDMNNVFIYSVNSQIGGSETIGQSGQSVGTCVLNSTMNANATASGMADNCASSGKSSKKKVCKGKGGGIGSYILYFIVGIIAFTVVMMIIKFLRGNATLPPCTKDTPQGTPCKPAKVMPCTKDTPSGTVCSPACTKDTPKDTLCYPFCDKNTPKDTPCYMKPLAPKPLSPPVSATIPAPLPVPVDT